MTPINISVVSPVYGSATLVPQLVSRLESVLADLGTFEIVLVEDGSPDESWEKVVQACRKSPRVVGIKLSRNFGQHHAIAAGLAHARGERVVVMDCDLQDPPEEIPRLLGTAQEGYDVVLARRLQRRDSWLNRVTSKGFYRFLTWLTGAPQDPAIANFGVYHRKVVDAINSLPEQMRFFPTMVRWVGFRTTTVDIQHAARSEGRSAYNLRKRLSLAADICLAYSDKPLRLVIFTGFAVSSIGFGFAIFMILRALRGEIEVLGYASLIVSVWILSGLLIQIMGVVGLYVGKTFEGVKNRPTFLVDRIERYEN